jgi:hypothetical protein
MNASQRRATAGEDGFVGAGVETPCVSLFVRFLAFSKTFTDTNVGEKKVVRVARSQKHAQ